MPIQKSGPKNEQMVPFFSARDLPSTPHCPVDRQPSFDQRVAVLQTRRVGDHPVHVPECPRTTAHRPDTRSVDRLHSDGSGGYRDILDDGMIVRVSRSYAPDIRDCIL